MPLPNLLFAILCDIEPIDRASTTYDTELQEPVGSTKRATFVTVSAQVKIETAEAPAANAAGIEERDSGYLLVRQIDIDRIGYAPKRGDRIIRIGTRTALDLYVTRKQYRGHWTDQGGHSLIRLHFADRHPTRQRGDL